MINTKPISCCPWASYMFLAFIFGAANVLNRRMRKHAIRHIKGFREDLCCSPLSSDSVSFENKEVKIKNKPAGRSQMPHRIQNTFHLFYGAFGF